MGYSTTATQWNIKPDALDVFTELMSFCAKAKHAKAKPTTLKNSDSRMDGSNVRHVLQSSKIST